MNQNNLEATYRGLTNMILTINTYIQGLSKRNMRYYLHKVGQLYKRVILLYMYYISKAFLTNIKNCTRTLRNGTESRIIHYTTIGKETNSIT